MSPKVKAAPKVAPKVAPKEAKEKAPTIIEKPVEAKKEPVESDADVKPKRAPSSYINFCKIARSEILREHPGMAFTEVGQEMGSRWRNLSDAEKEKFKTK